jgi:hypothetical protein
MGASLRLSTFLPRRALAHSGKVSPRVSIANGPRRSIWRARHRDLKAHRLPLLRPIRRNILRPTAKIVE